MYLLFIFRQKIYLYQASKHGGLISQFSSNFQYFKEIYKNHPHSSSVVFGYVSTNSMYNRHKKYKLRPSASVWEIAIFLSGGVVRYKEECAELQPQVTLTQHRSDLIQANQFWMAGKVEICQQGLILRHTLGNHNANCHSIMIDKAVTCYQCRAHSLYLFTWLRCLIHWFGTT